MAFVLALALLASACETIAPCSGKDCPTDAEILAQAGAVRLQPEQVKAHVAGNTEQWIHGGAFYQPDGGLQVKWRKVRYKAAWGVSADGTLCYQLPKWERRCHFYMAKQGEIYMLEEGRNIGVRATYEGNRLVNLGRYVTGLERKK